MARSERIPIAHNLSKICLNQVLGNAYGRSGFVVKIWITLLGTLIVAGACYPRSYDATTIPQEGLRVTYTVVPMFGFHSDWTRAVSVNYGVNEIQQDLFEDTGWWRGSNLYRYKSGIYVIDEGQAGCFGFMVEPLSFDVQENISCKQNADFTYLGAFVETPNAPDGAKISFVSADEEPEVELPDPL
jgi:hypothetical protein